MKPPEMHPKASKEDLAAHSSFPVLVPDWNENEDGQHAGFSGNPSTHHKMGSPPNAPSPQRPKVSGRDERERGDQASAGHIASRNRALIIW